MGGASTQFREELDLAAQAKAAKAKADALAIKEEQERQEEIRQFGITSGQAQEKIDIQTKAEERLSLTEKRKGTEFKLTHGLDVKVFEFEKEVWYDEFRLENDKYLLEKKILKKN